jgi:hypothetical protein
VSTAQPPLQLIGPLESSTTLLPVPANPLSPSGTDALVQTILLQNLPREYENAKKWGMTKRRWNGVDVSFDGLRLDTKRRWKEVNHGTWTRYRASLIDPEHSLKIHLSEARPAENQSAMFDVIVDAQVNATGRLSEWNRGVQLYSFSADADAQIRLQMSCEMTLQFDATKLPPDVILSPKVTDAKLELLAFRLNRISDADGPLVRKFGEELHNDINREIAEQRPKLVEKINRSIGKNREHLRLSVSDLIAGGWEKMLPK